MRIIFYCAAIASLISFTYFPPTHSTQSTQHPRPISIENNSFQTRKMLNDIEFIASMLEISYAPNAWKSEYFGWDLDEEKQKAKDSVIQNISLSQKDYQRIVKKFGLSTKDYHVVPQFYSTESSKLPFQMQSVDGKYFFTEVDSNSMSSDFPFSIGDEILLFNGEPVQSVVEKFCAEEIGTNYPATDKALAEFYLTSRIGSSGHTVPQGETSITFRKSLTDEVISHELEWDYEAEIVVNTKFPHSAKHLGLSPHTYAPDIKNLKDPFQKQFMSPHFNLFRSIRADNNQPSDLLGSRKSKIPPLGKILWESENHEEFYAYLFMTEDWKIGGYIRVPSFYVDGDSAANEFAEIVELFEELSQVLVIDQLNNGGGFILYLYALLAMLTDHELDVPTHRMMLTQEDVYHASKRNSMLESIKTDRAARKKLGDTIEGVIVNLKLAKGLKKSHEFIIDQWNLGNLYTEECYLYGIEKIQPHPEVNYTKPILILTNALDFSAADFFPAIMQDNARAKIMGTRTAGAGGYVTKVTFPNLNGIEEIDITSSFSMRQNGSPIENLGVTPDIIYEVTQNDLQNNYVNYKQKILDEVGLLLGM